MQRRAALRALLAGLLVLSLAGCGRGAGAAIADRGVLSATSNPGHPLQVVGLGDSVVAGTACGCQTYVERYAALVRDRTGALVRWDNDGVGGLTSQGLLAGLRSGSMAADVRRADVVLITIGANDLLPALDAWPDGGCASSCMSAGLPALRRNIAAIVERVHALSAGRAALVAVTNYWNVFEDGQVADRDYGPGFAAWSDQLTRLANTAICSSVHTPAACVDLYVPFNGDGDRDPTSLLADDGDHPNAGGHQVIAQALAAAVMPVAR